MTLRPRTAARCICVFLTISSFLNFATGKKSRRLPNPASNEKANTANGQHRYDFAHVVNLHPVARCDEPFCPFDQAQNVAISSMLRAQKTTNSSVLLAAAAFPEEAYVVPPEFLPLPYLQRSTASVYTNLKKKLPFVQDIFDSLFESGVDFDYLVFTNSDITLHKNFYDIIQEKVNSGLEAFTINRLIVPKARANGTFYNSNDLDEVFELEAEPHVGFDCFVIKRSYVERLQMGKTFLGFPPWDHVLHYQLIADNAEHKLFRSFDLNATFNFGNDEAWDTGHDQYLLQNWNNGYIVNRLWCLCAKRPDTNLCHDYECAFRRKGFNMTDVCAKNRKQKPSFNFDVVLHPKTGSNANSSLGTYDEKMILKNDSSTQHVLQNHARRKTKTFLYGDQ